MGEGDDLKDEANAAFAAEDFERAVKLYSRGIEMDDSNHILFSNRSAAYSKLKRFEEAKRDAERCVELKSDWPKGLARLATALFGMHRVGHAERALHKALELDPENDFLKSFLKDILSADGNQSAKKGMDGSDRGLRDLQQRAGYTLDPGKWKNQTAVVAFLGDVRSFTAMFQPADLLARETDLRMPILTLVVAGAQRMPSPPPHVDHKAVARLLIDAGARIDAKDAAGYTALMYACGHNPAVALAEILLEAGADPNVKSRYGTVALHDAVMGQQLDAVKLLLKHGASVRAADNDGVTPHKLARHFPPIAAAMAAARGGASDEQREITNTKARAVCQACGKENAHKACSKCRVVHYCSRQCQTFHWKTHKKECGKAAAQTGELRFEVTSPPCSATFSTANIASFLIPSTTAPELDIRSQMNPSRSDDNTFVVKIQLPLRGTDTTMMVYNRDKSFSGLIPGNTADGEELAKIIREKGVMKAKGYFEAHVDQQTKELVVLKGRMLQPQPW